MNDPLVLGDRAIYLAVRKVEEQPKAGLAKGGWLGGRCRARSGTPGAPGVKTFE